MALIACIYPATGTVTTPVAVSSSDTFSGNDIQAGGMVTITCAATPCTVTLTDPGRTAAGTTAGTVAGVTVAANTSRTWGSNVLKNFIDPSTNLVTFGNSATTNVTVQFLADGD